MSVKYRKIQRKVLNGPEQGKVKTYAIAKASHDCDMQRLCNLVSARTKMWNSEVKSVIEALIWVIDMELKEGAIIKMPGFGNFRYTIQSEGVENEDDFRAHLIKGVKLCFTPSTTIKKSYRDVFFEQDDVKVVERTEECPLPHVE
ncbi:MAG: HU family DNA-binding protein [Tannerellaceae bacterium]|nr:HU family DNA-binding protein [Tannerellaceae bacterium]